MTEVQDFLNFLHVAGRKLVPNHLMLMHMFFNEVTYSTTRSQVSRLYFVPMLAILNISLHTCMMYRSVDARTPRFFVHGNKCFWVRKGL